MEIINRPPVANPVIASFLEGYSLFLEEKKKDVDFGGQMLHLGTKTETVQVIENILLNPARALIDASSGIEKSLKGMIENIMVDFFSEKKSSGVINSVFKKDNNSQITYSIELSEDTFSNRQILLDFLDYYYTLDFSEKIDVYFQFVPTSLKEKFNHLLSVI